MGKVIELHQRGGHKITPNLSALPDENAETTHGNRRYAMVCWNLSSNLRYILMFKFLT